MTQTYRIIGPPGTGKTTRLAVLAQQAARKYGADAVMICSLTKAAAAEIGGRETPIPPDNVGTLHSAAYRALGSGLELADSPKGLKEWNEWIVTEKQYSFRLGVKGVDVDEHAMESNWGGDTAGDRHFARCQVARAQMRPVESLTDGDRGFWSFWSRFKNEMGRVDFTDLLEMALAGTLDPVSCPSVILVDEAQDIPRLGMALLRHWAERAEHLCIVGDPLQCLFQWCGSEPEVFAEGEAKTEILGQTWRFGPAIHAQAAGWIRPLKERLEREMGREIEFRPQDKEDHVRRLSFASWKHPEATIRDAERQISAGRTVMFQAACSHMLEPLLACLRKEGIPFSNIWRTKRGDWNPLGRRKGSVSAAERLLAFLGPAEGEQWTVRKLWHWLEWCEAKGLVDRGGKSAIADAAKDGMSAETLAMELIEEWFEPSAIRTAVEAALDGKPEWWQQHLLDAKKRSVEFPVTVYRKRGIEALREKPLVTIGTIHSLKGSQADVVYLWPDLSQAGMDEWHYGGAGRDGIIRAFYVGMTRAREELVLCGQSSPLAVTWN